MSWFTERFEEVVEGDEVDVHTTDGTTYQNARLIEVKDDGIIVSYGPAVVFVAEHELADLS